MAVSGESESASCSIILARCKDPKREPAHWNFPIFPSYTN